MQNFNLHTHTYRCGHAQGTEEELVLAAIQAGFKTLGFSEHLPFADWEPMNSRILMEEVEDYLSTVEALKIKYQDQIQILTGFESEYFEDQQEWLKTIRKKVDYLILGQHIYFRNPKLKECCDEPYCQPQEFKKNAQCMIDGIKSGLFSYVAHPDYVLLNGIELSEEHLACFKEIAKTASEYHVPIEVNLKGTTRGTKEYKGVSMWKYPNARVMEIFKEAGCQFVCGYDVHSCSMLFNREVEKEVRDAFEPLNLNWIYEIDEIVKSQ